MHFWVLWVWLAICALQDLRQRHIANGLTLGAALLATVYLLWSGTTWLGAGASPVSYTHLTLPTNREV